MRVTRAGGRTVCASVVCECARIGESKALFHAGSRNKPSSGHICISFPEWRKRVLGSICTAYGSQVQRPLCWEPESSESNPAPRRGGTALGEPLGSSTAGLGWLLEPPQAAGGAPAPPTHPSFHHPPASSHPLFLLPSALHFFSPLTGFFLLLSSSNYSLPMLISGFLFLDCCNPPNPSVLQGWPGCLPQPRDVRRASPFLPVQSRWGARTRQFPFGGSDPWLTWQKGDICALDALDVVSWYRTSGSAENEIHIYIIKNNPSIHCRAFVFLPCQSLKQPPREPLNCGQTTEQVKTNRCVKSPPSRWNERHN